MKIVGIIPVRMGSTRFPGKPLAKICGISMIEHIFHRSSMSQKLTELWVAACDEEIKREVERFGGKVAMTSNKHERCTDRVAEAVKKNANDADIVINIQGDEALLHPQMIDLALQPLMDEPDLQTVHLVGKIKNDREFEDPNEVKVVFDQNWNTLYCSREPIPSSKKGGRNYERWKQVCIISFRKDFLFTFSRLPQTPLEKIESVDMMRAVEHGFTVRCVESPFTSLGVDTPEDLARAEELMKNDPLFKLYN